MSEAKTCWKFSPVMILSFLLVSLTYTSWDSLMRITSLDEMKMYAEKLKIFNYVTFTGRTPDREILNTAYVCVYPDLANDMNDKSTINRNMEYMTFSKPIMQYDLTDGRNSAQENSIYAEKNNIEDFAEKILALLDDTEKREEMGATGKNRILSAQSWEHEEAKLYHA